MVLGIVAAVGGLCVGCGGASGDSATGSLEGAAADGAAETSESAELSFPEEATKLCDELRQKYLAEAPKVFARELQRSGGSIPPQQLEAKVIQRALASSLQEKVDQVRALGIPKGDEKQVEAILAAIEDVAEKAQTKPALFLFQQSNFKHPFFKARHMADEYGIGHCARA
ncbi:MAG TPA: hypothetical protein VFU11_04645 [Solirubrobacterales bacterium]|nr:hypothetical protein [Solirubrobacterales bacterium]